MSAANHQHGPASNIRNIAFIGQMRSGKTTAMEGMLFALKATKRFGSVDDGSSVLDCDPQEKTRKQSIFPHIFTVSGHDDVHMNMIDTPGAPDFIGGVGPVLRGAETALCFIAAHHGLEMQTRKLFEQAGKLGKTRGFVVTHVDHESQKDAQALLGELRKMYGTHVLPVSWPDAFGPGVKKIQDLIHADNLTEDAQAWRGELIETALGADEKLMAKYLAEGTLKPEEINLVLREGVVAGEVIPVEFTARSVESSYNLLAEHVQDLYPAPADQPKKPCVFPDGTREMVDFSAYSGGFLGQVIRTVADPFVGRVSYIRAFAGEINADGITHTATDEKGHKVGHMFAPLGKERKEIKAAQAGEIFCFVKHDEFATGVTVYTGERPKFDLAPLSILQPMSGLALSPKSHKDEAKMPVAVARLVSEDPTLEMHRQDNGEMVLMGVSQLHLETMIERMRVNDGVDVTTAPPKIPYLETISAAAEGHFRHRKQSGGAGQFAEVYLRVKPGARGSGYEFVDAVVGGAIPRQFIPSCNKGIQQVLGSGILAGCKLTDIVAEVYDGKDHPVDSKDIAFQTAARKAFIEAFHKARPILLEPFVNLEVMIPAQYMGDVSSRLSVLRGRIEGTDQVGDFLVVKAQAPLAEVQDFNQQLRAMTKGTGSYTIEFSHNEVVPPNIKDKIIKERGFKIKEDEE
ncbi:MAG TPA: elongation factor G [Planctomycetota bacterium]|nr:elongation factor G [Planctomycetota bacterium]